MQQSISSVIIAFDVINPDLERPTNAQVKLSDFFWTICLTFESFENRLVYGSEIFFLFFLVQWFITVVLKVTIFQPALTSNS